MNKRPQDATNIKKKLKKFWGSKKKTWIFMPNCTWIFALTFNSDPKQGKTILGKFSGLHHIKTVVLQQKSEILEKM